MEMATDFVDDYATHVTVTDGKDEYQYSISLKRENVTVEDVMLDIFHQMYPDKPKSKHTLEETEEWIKDGCNLRDDEGQFTGKAEKVEWKSTHPKPSKLDELEARIKELEAGIGA